MAQKGWRAAGLLRPLWNRYEGGRDALAAATGTTGTVLSSINSGKRNMGIDLGQRLADELRVSVLELGAPTELADPLGLGLLARLEALEVQETTDVVKLRRDLNAAKRRIQVLEQRSQPASQQATRRPKKRP